jgi:hypothetical protein
MVIYIRTRLDRKNKFSRSTCDLRRYDIKSSVHRVPYLYPPPHSIRPTALMMRTTINKLLQEGRGARESNSNIMVIQDQGESHANPFPRKLWV